MKAGGWYAAGLVMILGAVTLLVTDHGLAGTVYTCMGLGLLFAANGIEERLAKRRVRDAIRENAQCCYAPACVLEKGHVGLHQVMKS